MKKRIGLFLTSKPHEGGAFQYSLSMIEAVSALPPDRFDARIAYGSHLWTKYLKDCEIASSYQPLGIWEYLASKSIVGHLPMQRWRSICPGFHPVAKRLISQRCDLWLYPSSDTWSYLIPVPSLVSIHDLMHRYERRFPEVAAKYWTRERHYSNMCRWVTGALVDSQLGKSHVVESYGLAPKKVHVLPFIAPGYMSSAKPLEASVNHHALPSKYLFYPAQFWEHKNHKGLIHAVASLKERIPDLHIVFVGSEKNGYQSTRDLVSSLNLTDRVQFLGYVRNEYMPELYRHARALVMPTFFGPTNIPPLEAIAVGCPVAVSDIYGMREQLGSAALFFDPSSIDQIASAIERLWNDDELCRELSKRGLMRSSQWTQPLFSQRLKEIIEKILMELAACRRENTQKLASLLSGSDITADSNGSM